MEKLTREQEKELLRAIKRNHIGHGSSRTVFRHPFNRKLAIKIAIGDGGKNQNKTEIEVNQKLPQYTNTIHAYGENIIVCDLIIRDWRNKIDMLYYGGSWSEDKRKFFKETEKAIIQEIIEELDEINGDTADNYQIGKTINGKIVAYDYGFISHCGLNHQVDFLNHNDYTNSAKIALEQLGE